MIFYQPAQEKKFILIIIFLIFGMQPKKFLLITTLKASNDVLEKETRIDT